VRAGSTRAQRFRLLPKSVKEGLNEGDPKPVGSLGDALCTGQKKFSEFCEHSREVPGIVCHDDYPVQHEAAPVSPERSAWIGGHGTEP
jgi:hypothetical protein